VWPASFCQLTIDAAAAAQGVAKGVRRILVRGVSAPLPPEAKKILKI